MQGLPETKQSVKSGVSGVFNMGQDLIVNLVVLPKYSITPRQSDEFILAENA